MRSIKINSRNAMCSNADLFIFVFQIFEGFSSCVCVLIVSLPMNVCSSQLGVCVIHWLAT